MRVPAIHCLSSSNLLAFVSRQEEQPCFCDLLVLSLVNRFVLSLIQSIGGIPGSFFLFLLSPLALAPRFVAPAVHIGSILAWSGCREGPLNRLPVGRIYQYGKPSPLPLGKRPPSTQPLAVSGSGELVSQVSDRPGPSPAKAAALPDGFEQLVDHGQLPYRQYIG